MAGVSESVDAVCEGKHFVLVDGVGFPGVGSVVGCSNADVAAASKAPVLLVREDVYSSHSSAQILCYP